MGEHSAARGWLSWVKAHPKVISAVVVGVVGVISAVRPDFPAAAVLAAVHTVLGV